MEEAFAQQQPAAPEQEASQPAASFTASNPPEDLTSQDNPLPDFQPQKDAFSGYQPQNNPVPGYQPPNGTFAGYQSQNKPVPGVQPRNDSFSSFQPKQGAFAPSQGVGQPQSFGSGQDAPFAKPYMPNQQADFSAFQTPAGQEPPKKKKSKAGLWIGIAAGAVVLIAAAVVLILMNRKPKMVDIDLNPYAKMEFSGQSGSGNFTFTFDEAGFIKEYEDKIQWMDKKNATENSAAKEYYDYCVSGHFSAQNGTLSNGDQITVFWDINADASPYFNVGNLQSPSKDFTVSGLNEIEAKDPFEGLIVDFDGTSPYITVSLDTTGMEEAFKFLQYVAEPGTDLAEGDEVTVKVLTWENTDPTAYLEEKYHVTPTQLSKTYTVTASSKYITSASQIASEQLTWMETNGRTVFEQRETQSIPEGVTVDNLTYVGNVFLSLKEPDNQSTMNAIFTFYKVDVTITTKEKQKDDSGNETETEVKSNASYYWCAEYDDLIAGEDGNIVDLEQLEVFSPTVEITLHDGKVHGFVSLDDFLKMFESEQLSVYAVENNLTE